MQDLFLNKKIIKKINIILLVCLFCSFVSYCLFLRGLESDGVEKLAEIIHINSFTFEETARMFFHFLYQIPIVLFLKLFPVAPLYLIKLIYSFSLLWLHILAFLSIYFILPKEKKEYLFFPLMGFILGPMGVMGLSISVSFLTYSCIWAVAFIIHYSNLSIRWQKVFFIISILFLFFSHEMMSYMAWFLIYLCYKKSLLEKSLFNKIIIYIGMLFLIINSFLSTIYILFPTFVEHRSYFIKSLAHLYFFYKNGLYTPVLSSFCLLVIFVISCFFHFKFSKLLICILTPIFLFFCIMNFITPIYSIFENHISFWNEYDKRVWPVISLPFTLIIWLLFEFKKINIKNRLFILYCVFLSISLTGWRIVSDYRFYQYQTQLAKKLSHCSGYVTWNELQKDEFFFKPHFIKKFYTLQEDPEEHIINSSLFYSNSFMVKSIIQSEFKPIWFCQKSKSLNTLFYYNKKDYKNFIQLKCKDKKIQKLQLNRFDFSNFIESIKIRQSSCKKSNSF